MIKVEDLAGSALNLRQAVRHYDNALVFGELTLCNHLSHQGAFNKLAFCFS